MILAVEGSPRKGGNSHIVLTAVLRNCQRVLFLLAMACISLSCSGVPKQSDPPAVRADNALYGNTLVHYLDAGQGGTPLILVHGWGGNSSFWEKQIDVLARKRRVLALDLPGHGLSGKLEVRYTQPYFADGVAAVMDHAGINRAVLAGHSMGGSVIRQVALRHPERVAGLILVEGALFDPPQEYGALLTWRLQMEGFVNSFRSPSSDLFTWEFLESLHTDATPDDVRETVRESVFSTPNHVRVSAMEWFVDPEIWRGGPVHAPTLAVYAVSPDLPDDFETTLRKDFPDLTYHVWDGPGHFIMLERPKELSRLIAHWLKEQEES